jgi:prevent-host-death family protein
MRTVGVAELKAKLSAFLRRVQRGEEIVVLDRDTPVARLAPYASPRPEPLPYRPAARKLHSRPRLAPLPKLDVDAALREERRDRQ